MDFHNDYNIPVVGARCALLVAYENRHTCYNRSVVMISAPKLRWSEVLFPSSSSPSSPATLVAGVLCHRPTQEHSCDPVRSPRPEHGGLSAPVVTGSRTPDTASRALHFSRTARNPVKYPPELRPARAGYMAGSAEAEFASEAGEHFDKRFVKKKKEKERCVRALQDNRLFKKPSAVRAPLHVAARWGRVPAADSAWVTRERSLQTTPTPKDVCRESPSSPEYKLLHTFNGTC